jgi:chromosome segregation protein
MAHIKKLVMHGFKSFAKKTEILFDEGISVVIGPNGSGKSNISDALCFVLGRLSIKSMRATKAKNLLFMGSKFVKPAQEAYVDLVFDNSDKTFNLDKDEIHLKRLVRRNGQSVYKINGETKTRGEVIELLAHAGIDPHGFNLVLQGQIQAIVKMHPDERRKIIEEVAGIAIYESRKEKSLRELDKTEEKLKEISAILKERGSYMRNLDRERAEALRFKDLEKTVKKCKASILHRKKELKEKEIESVVKSIGEKNGEENKVRKILDGLEREVENLHDKVEEINGYIRKATGIEQETLHREVVDLKASLEGLNVRKESFENRREEIERRIEEIEKNVPDLKEEIEELREKAPGMAKKAGEVKKKKEVLNKLAEDRKRLLGIKSELQGLRDRVRDREQAMGRARANSDSLVEQMEDHSKNLRHEDEKSCFRSISSLKEQLGKKRENLEELGMEITENEKIISVSESEIERAEEVKKKVGEIDAATWESHGHSHDSKILKGMGTCPLCQTKISKEHIGHVFRDSDERIGKAKNNFEKSKLKIKNLNDNKYNMIGKIKDIEEKIDLFEKELVKHESIKEKKERLKNLLEEEDMVKKEIEELEKKRKDLEVAIPELGKVEERHDSIILEIEEISSRTEEDVDTTLLYKEREIENMNNIISRSRKDLKDIDDEIKDIAERIEIKEKSLEGKEEKERELNERFERMFTQRDDLQKTSQEKNLRLSEIRNEIRQVEDQINYLRIGKAKLDAELEALQMELEDYIGVELIKGAMNYLEERLIKSKDSLGRIGSINMRALEVYEGVKKEYEKVEVKTETLAKEKDEILRIIEEIDKKKKKEFMKTFKAMNDLFSENFAKLSTKGKAELEIENKEDIFGGGVNISVKLAKGKYFDVTSLSGGEQTLVALSLLFAIQEHKPYHFYVFDEIDAALDKRNSERLAGLLDKYMKSGQYIVVSHNDAIIHNSNVLYGVSMHEGVSKVVSLELSK